MSTGTANCALPNIPNVGARRWSMTRDRKGYRRYEVVHRVQVDRDVHGPLSVIELTPGLPEPGSRWYEPDIEDTWAFFTQELKVDPVGRESNNNFYDVTQYATNDPTDECAEELKDDPLSINDRIRVESINYQREQIFDANGDAIINSAWEQYRGPQVEFDDNRIQVVIEQNAGNLELDLIDSLMHHVNDQVMWGFAIGTIRLTSFSADPKYHTNCDKYWLRRFTFEVDTNTHVRTLLDEGTKVLHGRWDQNKGTGCILDLVVTAGVLTNATINTTGSGYPPSCIVPLRLNTGTAIVLVETNSAGTPIAVVRIHKAGATGFYTNGAAASTTQRGYWVLLRINGNGEAPDPNNPQHFDRPGDIKGVNARWILDGKGMPIAEDEDPGEIEVEHYPTGNLLLLGIPLGLESP